MNRRLLRLIVLVLVVSPAIWAHARGASVRADMRADGTVVGSGMPAAAATGFSGTGTPFGFVYDPAYYKYYEDFFLRLDQAFDDIQYQQITDIASGLDPSYRTVFLILPDRPLTTLERQALVAYVNPGLDPTSGEHRRLVLVGEYGLKWSGINERLNEVLRDLGVQCSFNNTEKGYYEPYLNLTRFCRVEGNSRLTWGVTGLWDAATDTFRNWNPDVEKPLAYMAETPALPWIVEVTTQSGGSVVLIHDSSMFELDYSDTHDLPPYTRNFRFVYNLCAYSEKVIDLDIDSDNNNGLSDPDQSDEEDKIEDDVTLPGKVLYVNDDDNDHDGLVDFADGFNWDGTAANRDDQAPGEAFVPLILRVGDDFDLSTLQVTVTYDASDPAGVTKSDSDPNRSYNPADGSLRIWARDGHDARNKASVTEGGDYVPSGTFTAGQIGLSVVSRLKYLFVEGISPSKSDGDQRILVRVDDGSVLREDSVRVTVRSHEVDLDVDSDNQNGFDATSFPDTEDKTEDDPSLCGKRIAAASGDCDSDGIPDFADGFNLDGASSNDDASSCARFVPLVLELREPMDTSTAKITFRYSGSDPASVVLGPTGEYQQPQDGNIRIWTVDGGVARNKASVGGASPGQYVPADVALDAAKLGITNETRKVTLYLEAVVPSEFPGDLPITVAVDDATGTWKDTVRVTVYGLSLIPERWDIMAGAVQNSVHQTVIAAAIVPPGLPPMTGPVSFSVKDPPEGDACSGYRPASLSSAQEEFDANGEAQTILTSSDKVELTTVEARYEGLSASAGVNQVQAVLGDFYVSPQPVIVGPAEIRLLLYQEGTQTPVAGHSVIFRAESVTVFGTFGFQDMPWDPAYGLVDADPVVTGPDGTAVGAFSPGILSGIVNIVAEDQNVCMP